jgi:hypothetical protein
MRGVRTIHKRDGESQGMDGPTVILAFFNISGCALVVAFHALQKFHALKNSLF